VTLPLVAGRTSLSRSTLEGLRLGDALLLGSGWFDAATPTATAVAVAPTEERGFRLSIADAVRYVEGAQVPHDDVTAAGAENPVDDATKESVIADTPVVVRVEVGSITLNAQEWMQLQPGDVLSCGVPPQSPVVLRAAGREIARGELVTVDGEVGVRISRLAGGADDETLPSPAAPQSR
jgi:type III secretion system YscQ/HrcQ family protein